MVQNIHNRELKKNMSEMYFNRKCTMNPKCYHHVVRGGYKIRPADKIESNEYIISRYQGVSTITVWITYCLMNSSEYLYHSDQRKTHCMRKKVLKTITIFPFKIEI